MSWRKRERRPSGRGLPLIGRFVAGQRIAHAGPLEAGREVELGALPADRIELEGADAFGAESGRVRQVADALAVLADRDDVDDVLDAVVPEPQPGLAPRAELAPDLGLHLPALRRDEVGVAGILAVLLRLGWARKS